MECTSPFSGRVKAGALPDGSPAGTELVAIDVPPGLWDLQWLTASTQSQDALSMGFKFAGSPCGDLEILTETFPVWTPPVRFVATRDGQLQIVLTKTAVGKLTGSVMINKVNS